MDTVWNFFTQHGNYILLVIVAIIAYILGGKKSITDGISKAWGVFSSVVSFFADAFREPDNDNGTRGKTSFTRLLGTYVTYNIVQMGWVVVYNNTMTIPEKLMTLFWVLIGFAAISKIWTSSSPTFQQLIQALVSKWQGLAPGTLAAPAAPAPVNDTEVQKVSSETRTSHESAS